MYYCALHLLDTTETTPFNLFCKNSTQTPHDSSFNSCLVLHFVIIEAF